MTGRQGGFSALITHQAAQLQPIGQPPVVAAQVMIAVHGRDSVKGLLPGHRKAVRIGIPAPGQPGELVPDRFPLPHKTRLRPRGPEAELAVLAAALAGNFPSRLVITACLAGV